MRISGWSSDVCSSDLLALFGLVGPFAAVLINHFGVRRIALVALGLIGIGVLGSFAMTGLWQLFLLWGLVVGTGTGLTAMVLGATVATRWFVARRGLVRGLLTARLAGGQLLFLPGFAAWWQAWGWRPAPSLLQIGRAPCRERVCQYVET